MNDGGGAPPGNDHGAPPTPAARSVRSRLEAARQRLLRHPLAHRTRQVMRAYDRGGGGMLAAALAYFAFFTMVPALLLLVSLLGVLVEDRDLREQLVNSLVDRLDPVSEVASAVIDGLAGGGRTGSLIGILGLVWGASGFYGALQNAMGRMFPGPRGRSFLRTRLRGLLTVVLILGSLLAALVAIVALPVVRQWLAARCLEIDGLHLPFLEQLCALDPAPVSTIVAVIATMVVAGSAALLVYVVIPPDGPSLRQALLPAVLVGVAIGLFTSLFGWLAPLLMRQWLTLGIVGSVFISLIWFDLVFQALVYGAALARMRRDVSRRGSRRLPPNAAGSPADPGER